jgi:hypothetical protein
MESLQDIDALIAERESAIRAAQEDLAALRKVRNLLAHSGGGPVSDAPSKANGSRPRRPKPFFPPSTPSERLPKEGSAVRCALDTLAAVGTPMSSEDLYEAVQAAGIEVSKESFLSGMYRAKNEGRYFKQTGRGEFDLLSRT